MTELFLIAHKVRGEPAFDVAQRIECPECPRPTEYWVDSGEMRQGPPLGCNECDQLGYWWIIPTSGHRAYPYVSCIMLCHEDTSISFHFPPGEPGVMPDGLQDHYITREAPSRSLADLLGITNRPQAPTAPFPRRI